MLQHLLALPSLGSGCLPHYVHLVTDMLYTDMQLF
jgi:hypothetical protein